MKGQSVSWLGGCKGRGRTLAGIYVINNPDECSGEALIWVTLRPWLTISRIATTLSMIVISEFTEEYFVANLSVSVWVIIICIPLFILISFFISLGDRSFGSPKKLKEIETMNNATTPHNNNSQAQLRPIKERK